MDACGNTASFTQTITVPCCEGCSPGFWKNHIGWKSVVCGVDDTADDNYPDTTLSVMLRLPDGNGDPYVFPSACGDVTMLAALSQGGG